MKRHVRANWSDAVLVCAKCEKKLKGGFGRKGREKLSKLLKGCSGGKGRKARFGVVTVPCLKICPKGAVTVVRGSLPGDWQIVERGEPLPAVMTRLGLQNPPRDGEGDRAERGGGGSPQAVSPAESPLHQPAAGPPPLAGEDFTHIAAPSP